MQPIKEIERKYEERQLQGSLKENSHLSHAETKGRELPQQTKCLQSCSAVFGERGQEITLKLSLRLDAQKLPFHTLRIKGLRLDLIGIHDS